MLGGIGCVCVLARHSCEESEEVLNGFIGHDLLFQISPAFEPLARVTLWASTFLGISRSNLVKAVAKQPSIAIVTTLES